MKFYNRSVERKEITEMITFSEKHCNKIILLLGYSGVGKTGLMEHLFSTTLERIAHIHIHISKHSNNSIENGYYFNRLYQKLLEIHTSPSHTQGTKISSPLISLRIRQGLRFLLRWLMSFLQIYEGEDFVENKAEADMLQKRDFIVECLNETPHIVDFENIQNIDLQSLEFLQDIIRKTEQTVFVLEYTIEPRKENNYHNLYEEMARTKADVICYRIEKLDDDIALRLSPRKVTGINERENVLKAYHENNGNLYQVILYSGDGAASTDSIKAKIEDMVSNRHNKRSLFVLNIVYLNGGSIEKNTLFTITRLSRPHAVALSLSESDCKKALENLKAEKLVQESPSGFFIHDSVLTALENQDLNPMLFQAYETLVSYYTTWKPSENHNQLYRLSQLFSLYLRFVDERLLDILPDIRRAVMDCKYPQAIFDSLRHFVEPLHGQSHISERLFGEIHKLLFEINIEAGNIQGAWENLEKITGLSVVEERIRKARIYELGMTSKDVEAISDLIAMSEAESHERLLLELSRIHVAMRIWTQSETLTLIKSVIDIPAYRQFPEYAFALSDQAELIDSPEKAILLYETAIEQLIGHKKIQLAGYLYANISMSYGYMGRLEEAEAALKKGVESGIDEAVALNNSAALSLLRHNVNQKTADSLCDALLLNINRFEQLIIHNNLLIVHVLLKNWEDATAEYQYLISSEFESFKYGEFLHLNYQNLMFYCLRRGMKSEASKYVSKLRALMKLPDTSNGTRQVINAMLNHDVKSNIFYARFPYRAEFLCYWGIPSKMR